MRKFVFIVLTLAMCWFAAYAAHAAELSVGSKSFAGTGFTVNTTGDGTATFFLLGPATVLKREVSLGKPIAITSDEARAAGRYVAILVTGGESSEKELFVSPAKPAELVFLARPSRVATAQKDAISGVAFVFDEFRNLVLAPAPVKFDLSVEGHAPAVRSVTSREGIAWTQIDSTHNQGSAQFVASLPNAGGAAASVRRVVQQVAAEACNLHMKAEPSGKSVIVETDPVKDCSGNPLPDGTIVTFTETDSTGRSTVDARIKKDVARAELPLSPGATVTVASGVVVGNEVQLGGAR